MDKMREEFEGWWNSEGQKITTGTKGDALIAWQSSRAKPAEHDTMQLAEMVLSDCGISTVISDRLQRRVAERIQRHVDGLQAAQPADHESEIARLRALSVENIMVGIVPGEDGMGHEVYAKSVDQVERLISDMSLKLDELTNNAAQPAGEVVDGTEQELFVHEDGCAEIQPDSPLQDGDEPFCRFAQYHSVGDPSVGIPTRTYWALTDNQKGTALAALLAAQPAGEAVAHKANAGHPALQKLIDSIDIVDGRACWDYEEMYAVRDALNSAPPAQVPDGWQPIETAPKDGTAILLHYKNELGNGRTVKANFIQKFTEESMDEDWFDAREDGTCFVPEGWYELIDNWPEYTSVHINYVPTHWMPLPAAPQPKGGE